MKSSFYNLDQQTSSNTQPQFEAMTISLPFLSYLSNESLFQATAITLPAWLLLIVAPRWRGTRFIAFLAMAILSLIYVLLLVNPILNMGFIPFLEQFLNYGDVVRAFKSPDGVVIGWYVDSGKILFKGNLYRYLNHIEPKLNPN